MKKKCSKLLAILLAGIFVINSSIAYLSAEAEAATNPTEFSGLNPKLYKKNDTPQSKTGYSVSFQINDAEGIGHIPCGDRNHAAKYTPVDDASGSGLYRNGVKEEGMYLAAYCPNLGDGKYMQFVISWQRTSTPSISKGDVIRLQGSFERVNDEGTRYVLQFNRTEFRWTGEDWEQASFVSFENLTSILHTKNETGQSNTGSVSFHVDNVESIGEIPCYGQTHDKKYTPDQTVEGSGLYRNGKLETDMYLATFYPSGRDQMQFVISWQNTDRPSIAQNDIIRIQGSFEHVADNGTHYVLQFDRAEFRWTGEDWEQLRIITYSNLEPNVYSRTDTGWTEPSAATLSFNVIKDGIGSIPCTQYQPVDGRCYRNGEKDESMKLHALSNNNSGDAMQFYMNWDSSNAGEVGDFYGLEGTFEYRQGSNVYVLQFDKTEFAYYGNNTNGQAMLKNIEEKRFSNLKSNLYPSGQTSQLTNQTFSCWIPSREGLNAVPTDSSGHTVRFDPINGGGIYRNGVLDSTMYFATFSWDGGKSGLQYVVSCKDTNGTAFSSGDVVRVDGEFSRLDTTSWVRYVLDLDEYEVIWNGSAWAEYVTPEELGYQRITLADFGIRNGTYTDAHTAGTYTGDTLDRKYLDVDLRFTGDNNGAIDTSIRYGGSDGWSGIKIGARSGNTIYIYDAFSSAIGYSLNQLGISDYSKTFNLKFATKVEGANFIYSFWVNDILIAKDITVSNMTNCGSMLGIAVETGNVNDSISIGTSKSVTNSDVSYDLTDGSYLLTGSDIKVDGNAKNTGDTLGTAGTYTIVRTSDFVTTTQKVTLYRFGDVNEDGTPANQADATALESLLNEKGIHAVSTATDYAADINQDGKVSKKDLTLMKEIADGTKMLKDVKIPALTYDYLGGDTVMPIAGFNGPYNDSENTFLNDKTWQLVKDCGINMIASSEDYMGATIVNAEKYTLDAIEQAEKYGIGYLMRDDRMIEGINNLTGTAKGSDLDTYLNRYDYFGNFLGVHVKDEPTSDNLSKYKKVGAALNTYTNQVSWINALPYLNFANKTKYKKYVENIVTETDAKVIPFDDYPFDWGQEVDKIVFNTVTKYFVSLDTVRSVAEEKGIPFWGTVAAGGDWRNKGEQDVTDNSKIATEAETYWNVNTLLAFGAKGITWFPLVQPKKFANAPNDTYDYDRNGLISADPNNNEGTGITRHYEWAKTINRHIAQVDEILMKAKNKGIMVTGTTTNRIMNEADVLTLQGTDRLTKVESSGATLGTIVGCFDYRDSEAYYVVNYDVSQKQTITLTLDDNYYVRVMQQGKTEEVKPTTDKKVTLALEPGQAALVVLQSETEMFCKTSSGVTLDDLEADTDTTATVLKAVGGTSIGAVTKTVPFTTWGSYISTYFVDGTTYARKLTMYTPGDITYDGNINSQDLVRMKKAVGGKLTSALSKAQELSGDIDEDGNVEQKDLPKLREILVGK